MATLEHDAEFPNADFLERTGSEILGARLWRLPPQSANTLHKHDERRSSILSWKESAAFAWEKKR